MSRSLLDESIMLLLKGSAHKKEDGTRQDPGKRFYGNLINIMIKTFNRNIETARVGIGKHIYLEINPDWFASESTQVRIDVLEHECKHVINLHGLRYKISNVDDAYLWNIACDAEINEPLTSLHKFGVTQEKLKKHIPDLIMGETAEYYYKKIKQHRDENGGKDGEGDKQIESTGGNFDDHSNLNNEEGEGQNEELTKEIVRKAVQDAVEESGGRGNVPFDILKALDRLGRSTVSWKQHLRRFFARADQFVKKPTRMRRNRRYGLLYPGKKKDPIAHIAVGLDNSGSVGDNEFSQFFSELDVIAATGIKITIIQADCEVNAVYEYKPKMPIERKGYGGTSYMPAINKAIELKVDGMIYFGDGDIYGEELTQPRFPFLWALVRKSEAPATWGGLCRVKCESEE